MSQLYMPTWKTLNWHAHGAARKRRGSPTIWFDPEMTWKAKATGKRDRQCSYGDPALHAHGCNPSKKVIRAGVSPVGRQIQGPAAMRSCESAPRKRCCQRVRAGERHGFE